MNDIESDSPDPWRYYDFTGTGTWPERWPPVAYTVNAPDRVCFKVLPPPDACNYLGKLHGGFLAGLAENCLGLMLVADGRSLAAVTISLAFDYPASGDGAVPVEGEVELMRETGKLQFLRIVLRQGATVLLHGTGTLRKLSAR